MEKVLSKQLHPELINIKTFGMKVEIFYLCCKGDSSVKGCIGQHDFGGSMMRNCTFA